MKRISLLYQRKKSLTQQKKGLTFWLLPIVALLALSACVDLKENPQSFISEDSYYKTKEDADAAVNAIYFALNGPNGTQVPYNVLYVTGMEFMTDDVLMSLGATNPDVKVQSTLDHTPAALRVKEIWQQHYVAINRANIAVDKIPTIPASTKGDSTILKRLVLEAKFLRGLNYFNLVRLFGSVPLVLHETTSLSKDALQVERASADAVYEQIIKDFTDAAEGLPWIYAASSADAGRATAGAARGFLAQIYLTRANTNEANRAANVSTITNRAALLQQAIDQSDFVIKGGGYNLFPDYADVFRKASKNGVEHLFSAQFKSNANKHGNSYAQRNAALGVKGKKSGKLLINGTLGDAPTTDLLAKINSRPNDKRIKTILTSFYVVNGDTGVVDPNQNAGFKQVINKYYDADVPTNLIESGINVPILKYSDILFINAEANNELYGPNDQATNNYNKIRTRAGLAALNGLTKDQFRDSLYLDLRIENTHEYRRWFDLIREIDKDGNHILIKTLKVMKPAVADKHYWFPIPQTEIDINPKLTQNPGW